VRLGWRVSATSSWSGFMDSCFLPFVRLISRKPVLFDMYITTLDVMVYDRAVVQPESWRARLYGLCDWLSYKLSKRVVLESQSHIDWFCRTFNTDAAKFRRIFLAVDDEVIHPRQAAGTTGKFLVHFHGEYAPFHGVKYILQAANLLHGQEIEFQIIGRGITYEADQKLAAELQLTNVRFYDTVPYARLAEMMAQTDVCLGIFGDNDRVLRVTTNKVIEAIAMGRPLITARNEPVQELLTHKESVYLVPRADPRALADAILTLRDQPALRAKIGQGGFRVFEDHCMLRVLGEGFHHVIEEMDGDRL